MGLPVKLTLSLRTSPPPDGVEAERVLEEGSMTIGRGSDASWTIPDPARVISKRHCRIDAAPEGFSITDISTNGAFLNEQPIGNQVTRRLADGDLVRMGDIVIAAHIEDVDKVAADSVLPADGPFGDNENFPQPGAAAAPSPMGAGPIAEDWWKESPPAAAGTAGRLDSGSSAALGDAIVVSLVESFPGLDIATLAQGVDRAGAVIGDREWRAFYDRLQAFLRESYPENA
jgi:pSer/pThr/pTyr-binding forkhead associated (FHA) protein